ncbi:MAG: hypothetical protein J3R72DRAFT_453336 [Linnemannia gamsii]|nr:MAG: hypothetical protein J3R72DRAFT_453336 [Linnemannia gamsii]
MVRWRFPNVRYWFFLLINTSRRRRSAPSKATCLANESVLVSLAASCSLKDCRYSIDRLMADGMMVSWEFVCMPMALEALTEDNAGT